MNAKTFDGHNNRNTLKHMESDSEMNEIYRVSIKSFLDYKLLLQENYVEYKYIFLPLLKLVVKNFLS